ncbi:MAG: hypothetical protein PVH61_32055 [Candidatus Aminicenantes bacterium]
MKKNRNQFFCNSPFLEGFASINLFGQSSSFERKQRQPPNYEISRYFSEAAFYLNQSVRIFSEKHARK